MTFDLCELLPLTFVLGGWGAACEQKYQSQRTHTFVLTRARRGSSSMWRLEGTLSQLLPAAHRHITGLTAMVTLWHAMSSALRRDVVENCLSASFSISGTLQLCPDATAPLKPLSPRRQSQALLFQSSAPSPCARLQHQFLI